MPESELISPIEFVIVFAGKYNLYSLSKGFAANGVGIRKAYGTLNIAAQWKFTNPGAVLTVGVENVFSSTNVRAITDIPEEKFYTWVSLQFQKRIFKVTFTYRLAIHL